MVELYVVDIRPFQNKANNELRLEKFETDQSKNVIDISRIFKSIISQSILKKKTKMFLKTEFDTLQN